MVVRKMERLRGMAAGTVGGWRQRRWRDVAGAVVVAIAMVASVATVAGQDKNYPTYTVPDIDYRPLALAYLSAPYTGSFIGSSSDFRSVPKSPGTSIYARFLKATTEHPWEGIPFGLFIRDARLTVAEGSLGLDSGKPLSMALYAFLDDIKVRYTFKIRTFDSNHWRKQPDSFSVLSDTTFFLQTDVPHPLDFVSGAYIACVNERAGRTGTPNDPPCREGEGGQVVEDPLSETGEPALLMVGRSGRPEWLTEVETDICAIEADPGKPPKIAVPESDGRHQEISLDRNRKFGDRWCIRVTNLNYVAVLKDGIRIDDTLKKRLDSRLSKGGSTWRMLAAAPSHGGAQRIVFHPPESVAAPTSLPKLPPAPETNMEKTAASSPEKVVPPPHPPPAPTKPATVVPAGPPVTVFFKSQSAAATEGLLHSKVPNVDGAFTDVDRQQLRFALPPESGFGVVKCDAKQLSCRFDEQNIELLPNERVAIPKSVVVTVDFAPLKKKIDLTILREGPALLSIQHVPLKGKTIDLVGSEDRVPMLPRTVEWSPGDKLRVRPTDPEFQEVSEITIDGRSWQFQDDKNVELPLKLDGKVATIVIKTADRLFSVPVTVATSPKTAIGIKVETRTDKAEVALPVDAQSKPVTLDGVKPDHLLTVEPQEKERLDVVTMLLRGGKNPRHIQGPTLKFERSDFQGGAKLALNLEVNVQEAAFTFKQDKFRLQPVVQIGKRDLLLKSCKVQLEGFLEGSNFVHRGGYTEVTIAQDKRSPKTRSYPVKIREGADVCRGLVAGPPIAAAKIYGMASDATLPIPVRRPGSRVLVGIVSLSKDIRSKEHNWRAALEALSDVFDAGANEGKYLWGAIYGPQGQLLVTSGDSADYAPFDLNEVSSGSKMDGLTGDSGPPFASLVTRVAKLKDIADFEGNVDALIVADEPFGKCGWSDPPFAQGSRAAFVRLTGSASEGKEIVSGVRVCEGNDKGDKKNSDKNGVVAEVEVVTKEWSRGAENDVQLRRAIAEAAKGFLRPIADPKTQPKQQ